MYPPTHLPHPTVSTINNLSIAFYINYKYLKFLTEPEPSFSGTGISTFVFKYRNQKRELDNIFFFNRNCSRYRKNQPILIY